MATRIRLLTLNSSSESWVHQANQYYQKKISRFCEIEFLELKPFQSQRDDAQEKRKKDSEILLKKIESDDFVILLDEKGKTFTSIEWAQQLQKCFEMSKRKYVFVLGGPYGVSEELKARANVQISLSKMTMNHWVAEIMLLEQIYRAFCIQKNIPYHNV